MVLCQGGEWDTNWDKNLKLGQKPEIGTQKIGTKT